MQDCLRELEASRSDPAATVPVNSDRIERLRQAEIVVDAGCYLLYFPDTRWVREPDPQRPFVPDQFYSYRSDYEDKENHLHAVGFMAGKPWLAQPSIGYLGLGLDLAEILDAKLRHAAPTVRFCISVSFNVKPLDADDGDVRKDCRVSFHAIRAGEPMWSDVDIEEYLNSAFGLIEF